MTLTLDEAAIRELTHSTFGLVGRDTAARTQAVYEQAVQNASGTRLDIRTGNLERNLRARVEGTPEGVIGVVATNAMSTWHGAPFSYPSYLNRYGGPHGKGLNWMSDALRRAVA